MSSASASININRIETGDDPVAEITAALTGGGGITVVSGSQAFVGNVGNGDAAQSATYSGFNLVPNNAGLPTVSLGNGVLLTSGTANLPMTNTNTAFSFIPGTGSDADLAAILTAASAPSTITNDVNSFSFDFTVQPGTTSIEFDFVFGSDEFPDQGVTDVFGVFVDGVNYAKFGDGSLVSFVQGVNASNFIDNDLGTNNYDFEYDGFSKLLHLSGLLDMNLTTHSIKFAIADTSDSVFDSGVFIAGLAGGNATGAGGGGGVTPGGGNNSNGAIPEPTSFIVWSLLGAVCLKRRRR